MTYSILGGGSSAAGGGEEDGNRELRAGSFPLRDTCVEVVGKLGRSSSDSRESCAISICVYRISGLTYWLFPSLFVSSPRPYPQRNHHLYQTVFAASLQVLGVASIVFCCRHLYSAKEVGVALCVAIKALFERCANKGAASVSIFVASCVSCASIVLPKNYPKEVSRRRWECLTRPGD